MAPFSYDPMCLGAIEGEAVLKKIAFALLLWAIAAPVAAEPIRNACLKSDRGQGKGRLCACIQDAADITLTARDQRMAAGFFADPDRAQEVRQSKRRGHAAFWERYKSFGQTAEAFCSG